VDEIMNAYLFSGRVSTFDPRRGVVDSCTSLIVLARDEPTARAWFAAALQGNNATPEGRGTKIEAVVVSPVAEYLLTEEGPERIEWATLRADAEAAFLAAQAHYEQLGYWVDCNAVVPSGGGPPSVAALCDGLSEELRSGLNWSADLQHFFLVSALRLPASLGSREGAGQEAAGAADGGGAASAGEGEPDVARLERQPPPFPELWEKEATAVVKARNAVVAAWLWRRCAAATPLAQHPIRVEAWCGAADASDVEDCPAPQPR